MAKADTDWMRRRADDMDSVIDQVRKQLGVADDARDDLESGGAEGWTYRHSLSTLEERWEDLNKLLRDELERAAENVRFNASSYDGNENMLTEAWHDAKNWWEDTL
ncbi:hypothetical protein [Streptomyces fulvoviolaceus]|uniref:hypothetical protein n=1 Tax=Streptomyces fulvoviolaceus TaxID=285535 RepID=UPI0021BE34E1|nr:hypothetical protein [Streptomyces fulvoviolaceus]MCT9081456.1 hypothetical protein [Streptomyces fulvoviolaceus]